MLHGFEGGGGIIELPSDGVYSSAIEIRRIGETSVCRHNDSVIERIEFDITCRGTKEGTTTGIHGESNSDLRTISR